MYKLMSYAGGYRPNTAAIGHVIVNIWHMLVIRDSGHGQTRRAKHSKINHYPSGISLQSVVVTDFCVNASFSFFSYKQDGSSRHCLNK